MLNCRDCCENSEMQITQDFVLVDEYRAQCRCDCDYCQSGITINTHTRLDCLVKCFRSNVENLRDF